MSVCFFWCPVAHAAQGHFAHQLLNDLMENYSNALRPVEDTDKTLNVTLQVTLSQIKDMVSTHKAIYCCIIGDRMFFQSLKIHRHLHWVPTIRFMAFDFDL